ncbi:exosortase F system-associated membrane protein [Nonlabens agnitus]|uniref:Exosortase F system-associated protein n=1 Tax=Nonlabens agnitus TaxID=870484 RepID=A0A2S9WXI8_9FLAO|nr:exosortase F system-associated protein [Nonlabens agnitus]PRP68190.1 exosortase F system-associated protein [Nonlabens agnitus]
MKSILRVLALVGLILLLISVRYFQEAVFYDPLDDYFHGAFQSMSFPEMNLSWLLLSNALRYLFNGLISLAILWILFRSSSYIKASLWVYLFAFVLLNLLFVVELQFEASLSKMSLFYTRRFLIHPLLLFVLIAGGYFLKTTKTHSTTGLSEPDDTL